MEGTKRDGERKKKQEIRKQTEADEKRQRRYSIEWSFWLVTGSIFLI
jgi:hypothetical protein